MQHLQISCEIEALTLSLNLWTWLLENFPAQKEDYPEIRKVKDYVAQCPLCSYYVHCRNCPLKSCKFESDFEIWSLYVYDNGGWFFNQRKKVTKEEGLKAIKNIVNKMTAHLNKIMPPLMNVDDEGNISPNK